MELQPLPTPRNVAGTAVTATANDIYHEIDGVIEIEEWRDGEKLIPISWYEK